MSMPRIRCASWSFRRAIALSLIILSVSSHLGAQRLEIAWPTPNPAYFEGKPITEFIQPTASGEIESGLFGCRRSGGAQFHEGLDLKPLKRDRRGEPVDPIFAAMAGVVRHINRNPGDSNYGRYIVIEHPDVTPSIYTLYAHLSATEPGLKVGDHVERGQTIATMGRSSNGQAIPRDRAHMHFEMGVWLTRDFQSWYNFRKFGSRNDNGIWNGMNLMGFDPLDFFDQFRAHRVDTFQDYFSHLQAAVRLRVTTRKIPDFVQRYPSLLTKPSPADGAVGGWDVAFNDMGLPFAWTPLSPMEMMGSNANDVKVTDANETVLRQHRCKSLVIMKRGKYVIGRDLEAVLQLVFGFR
jgi:murein DD-endopeptidase MepM/ murein hydrolase activator NlpD